MLEVGSIVAGKLRIDRILGEGGMGVVAAATHIQLDQHVAIKVLRDELANDEHVAERFMREARASGRLKSEHVCRVSDVGKLETGEPYIVMELLEGEDLAHMIEKAPLTIPRAVDYVLQACVAIAEAHALGIVHRDLKPANLFVTRRFDGTELIKVLDFGIAKAPAAADFKLTKTSMMMGSPAYMSPEQLRSAHDVDARSDIWAIGVILYEAASGHLPFGGTSITELAVKVTVDPPTPLDVDPRYAAIVMRCLEKQPDQRFQTVGELAHALAPLGSAAAQTSAMLIAKLSGVRSAVMPIAATAHADATAATGHGQTAGQSAAKRSAGSPPSVVQEAARGSVAGDPGGERAVAPRSSRKLLFVIGGVLLAGAAAAATAFALRGDHPAASGGATTDAAIVHAPADAALVATLPVDAGGGATDAEDEHAELRAKMKQFAEAHDYYAVLQMADLDAEDPELESILIDAKQHYIAQQGHLIDVEKANARCAKARELAATAQKIVPDDTTLVAKAKACKARTTDPHPPEPTYDPAADLKTAQGDYGRGDYGSALARAATVLDKQPGNQEALKVATLAACSLKNVQKARLYYGQMSGPDRNFALFQCKKHGITPTDDDGPPVLEVKEQLAAANKALQQSEFANAIQIAERVVKLAPHNAFAFEIIGRAACRLKDQRKAQSVLSHLPPRRESIVRGVCRRENVPLE